MDYRVQGILQARILEWVAFPVSQGPSQPRDRIQVSHTLQADSLPAEPQGKPIYIYVCIRLFCIIGYYKILSIVPCATQ